jgi:hypothetical protein
MRRGCGRLVLRVALTALVGLVASPLPAQEQLADPAFDPAVARPAYAQDGPTVVIDEAHRNFHTAGGAYKTLADLLTHDGYRVRAGRGAFTPAYLGDIDVLIVANAGMPVGDDLTVPAFTEEECDALAEWVRRGGALLLVADHAPYGQAVEPLARRFGISVGKGWAFDHADSGITTQIVFSRENGLLGDHAIVRGRDRSEKIRRVRSFTGQSLGVPDGAVALMTLGPGAHEAPTPADLDAANAAVRKGASAGDDALRRHAAPADGRAQGLAMEVGDGRLVMLAEAAMLSAQIIRFGDREPTREIQVGMNVPGNDNRQFALNVLRWLSGALN